MNTILLDINNDILEIIGEKVIKILYKRIDKEEQTLNGGKIRFPSLIYRRSYIFFEVNKEDASKDDIKDICLIILILKS